MRQRLSGSRKAVDTATIACEICNTASRSPSAESDTDEPNKSFALNLPRSRGQFHYAAIFSNSLLMNFNSNSIGLT